MIRARIFITPSLNKDNYAFNDSISIKQTILREPSLTDEFYFEECEAANDCLKSTSFIDPVYMLFNQQRLNNLGQLGIEKFLESFIQKDDLLRELRSKCSDEQLASMIKSKYLQSASEITAWCRYMQSHVDEFNAEIKKVMEKENLTDKPPIVESKQE